jgi:hypothetical protein
VYTAIWQHWEEPVFTELMVMRRRGSDNVEIPVIFLNLNSCITWYEKCRISLDWVDFFITFAENLKNLKMLVT